VTDLCENKIAVSDDVRTEMHRLRTEGQLTLAVNPLYKTSAQFLWLHTFGQWKILQHLHHLQ